MINEYNKYMAGADKLDQKILSNSYNKKLKKWWKKVFFCLVEIPVINTSVLYQNANPTFSTINRQHINFRKALIHEMVQNLLDMRADVNNPNNNYACGCHPDIDCVRLSRKCFPSRKYPQRKMCSSCGYRCKNGKQIRKRLISYCQKCDLFFSKDCLESFHTRS